jgi:hypothetical protein
MKGFCGVKGLLIGPIAVVLLFATSCSRPLEVPGDEAASQASPTPFRETSAKADSDAAMPSVPNHDPKSSSPPFHDSQTLPAGTLLTVRLSAPISQTKTGAQESFNAGIDEDIVAQGRTLIPRGASVIGRVESTRTSKLKPNRGYLRLTLESVHLTGIDLPVQTASLFVRQVPQKNIAGSSVRLEKGHRLTFRLTEPLATSDLTARYVR